MNKAYLEITLKISDQNRNEAAGVYKKYKDPFLKKISGAESKELLANDVVRELTPLFEAAPEIRVYEAM